MKFSHRTLMAGVCTAPDRDLQHGADCFVERAACDNVAHDQLDMINQAVAVQFLSRMTAHFVGLALLVMPHQRIPIVGKQ